MSYLIDTDCVADFLNGQREAVAFLTGVAATLPAISIVTYGEIYEGIYTGRDPERAEQSFLDFLNEFDIIPLDLEIMRLFARISGELRRSGNPVQPPDLFIAATAIRWDLTLVTRNRRHFDRVVGLEVVSPPASAT